MMHADENDLSYPLQDKVVKYAGWACGGAIGAFAIWAVLAPLAEGVVAGGDIVVESQRKVIQHLEGGIIRKLYVREGDSVKEGDVIVELQTVVAAAQRNEIAQNLASHLASIERLNALEGGSIEVRRTDFDALSIADNDVVRIRQRQQSLIQQERNSFDAEISVLDARRNKITSGGEGRAAQIESIGRAVSSAREDLGMRRKLLQSKLETIQNVQRLERDLAALEADHARLQAVDLEMQAAAIEIDQQIAQARTTFQREISTDMAEERQAAMSAQERLKHADDILSRSVITAPQSGEVLNLAFSTIGGVVRPGETLMEIVPSSRKLVASARIKPSDRDSVAVDQEVRVRLAAFKSWMAPALDGRVLSVSADLKQDPDQSWKYYEVLIEMDLTDASSFNESDIRPGMPVEAFIDTGRTRTFLSYVLEPIAGAVRRGTQG